MTAAWEMKENLSREDMIMKKFFLLFAAAILMVLSCEPMSIEENVEKPNVDNIYTTIHYSLKSVSTGTETKVSYDATNGYSIKTGDKLSIAGKDRTDISGELEYHASDEYQWQGDLTYKTSEGPLDGNTNLVATLIHADNDYASSYANAVVGPDQSDMLKYAVENYSLLKAEYKYGATGITLSQQAAFLDVNVTFTFGGGTPQMQAGTTWADIETPAGTASGTTQLVAAGSNFTAHFMAVVPAGHNVQDFKITLCDRDITFDNSATLSANKKYTVTRTIDYKPVLGDPFWSDGTYGRYPHTNAEIIGVVVYVNDTNSDLDNAITEATHGGGHALVMALKNANPTPGVGEAWGPIGQAFTPILESPQDIRDNVSSYSGYSNTNTQALQYNCNAAVLAKGYDAINSSNYSTTTTGWFLPSIGQWFYSIITYGDADPITTWAQNDGKNYLQYGTWNSLIRVKQQSTKDDFGYIVNKLNERLALLASEYNIDYDSFGMKSSNDVADNYWTSSEASYDETVNHVTTTNETDYALRMNFGSVEGPDKNGNYYATIKTKPEKKSAKYSWKSPFIMKVRPFLAF